MTQKTGIKLENVISKFPKEHQELFRDIAEYVISLGYNPKVNAKETYADFVKSKHGKIILKIECGYEKPPATKIPRLNIRFDVLPKLFGIFEDALLQFKKSHCPKCGKCHGKFGLKYTLSNGNEVYTCRSTIYIPSFDTNNMPEIKEVLKAQDEHLIRLYAT